MPSAIGGGAAILATESGTTSSRRTFRVPVMSLGVFTPVNTLPASR